LPHSTSPPPILVRTIPALAAIAAAARTPLETLGVYLSLAVGPIAFEEVAPLGAGVAASQGRVPLWAAVVAMTLGGWAATAVLYALGRWRGRWIRRRFPRAGGVIKRLLRAVRRRPWQSALAVRYAFGARVLLPLACGAAHLRPDVYLIATFVSSATWSTLFALLGFWFGQTALAVIGRVREYEQLVVGVVAGLAVLGWLIVRRRRAAAAVAAAATPPSPGV
jgi:membrane protein DedA with SNARE-associated domain